MSTNKGGRPRNEYTDPLLKLISGKLRRKFVRDEFLFIPCNEVLEKYVVKDKTMKQYKLSVDQVIRTVRNYKKDLVTMMMIESKHKEKVKIDMPVYERPMDIETIHLLEIIVYHFHTSYMTKKFPGRGEVELLTQIMNKAKEDGFPNFTTEKIRTLTIQHRPLIIKMCNERGKLM